MEKFSGTKSDRLKEDLESFKAQLEELDNDLTQGPLPPHLDRKSKQLKEDLQKKIEEIEKQIKKEEQEGFHGGHRTMSKECFLNDSSKYESLGVQSDGRKYWRDFEGKYIYSWDGKSREVEVFKNNKNKDHAGTFNEKGQQIKSPIKNRNAKHVR